ncbi:MAG: hypothetical protein V1898_01615 [Patescibacteria group bacterium]
MKMKIEKITKIWSIFLFVAIVALFLFLLNNYFVFNGKLTISYDFCSPATLITEFTPTGRALAIEKNLKTGECYQRIVGEPVYFTSYVPRSFDTAEVAINYQNPSQSILELGVQKSIDWNFELKPLENKFIDNSTWDRINTDNIIFLQKQKKYNSYQEFLDNVPTDKKIATYNYSLPYKFVIDDYEPSDKQLEINTALRGRHEFYTYLGKGEDLDFTFYWQDINWALSADNFIVRIYKDDTEIQTEVEPGDGNTDISGTASLVKEKQIKLTNLSGGLFRIVVDVSNDVFIRKIITKQHLLVVKNRIFLADSEAHKNSISDLTLDPTTLYTNSDILLARTDHSESLQSISINNDKLELIRTGEDFKWSDDNNLGSIKIINAVLNDVYIQGFGYYSFTPESFFDPDYGIDILRTDMNMDNYDYLIAKDYSAPTAVRSWNAATQSFVLDTVPGDRKTLNFILSAPGITDINSQIIVKNIEIKFKKDPLNLKNLWPRLKFKLGL